MSGLRAISSPKYCPEIPIFVEVLSVNTVGIVLTIDG